LDRVIKIVERPVLGPRPVMAGTRLEVRHIVELVREFRGSEAETARYLDVDRAVVAEAMRYYAAHREAIDAWIREEDECAELAYAEWLQRRERAAD
jgi:uncharacterized protein (DUF433 family)